MNFQITLHIDGDQFKNDSGVDLTVDHVVCIAEDVNDYTSHWLGYAGWEIRKAND